MPIKNEITPSSLFSPIPPTLDKNNRKIIGRLRNHSVKNVSQQVKEKEHSSFPKITWKKAFIIGLIAFSVITPPLALIFASKITTPNSNFLSNFLQPNNPKTPIPSGNSFSSLYKYPFVDKKFKFEKGLINQEILLEPIKKFDTTQFDSILNLMNSISQTTTYALKPVKFILNPMFQATTKLGQLIAQNRLSQWIGKSKTARIFAGCFVVIYALQQKDNKNSFLNKSICTGGGPRTPEEIMAYLEDVKAGNYEFIPRRPVIMSS